MALVLCRCVDDDAWQQLVWQARQGSNRQLQSCSMCLSVCVLIDVSAKQVQTLMMEAAQLQAARCLFCVVYKVPSVDCVSSSCAWVPAGHELLPHIGPVRSHVGWHMGQRLPPRAADACLCVCVPQGHNCAPAKSASVLQGLTSHLSPVCHCCQFRHPNIPSIVTPGTAGCSPPAGSPAGCSGRVLTLANMFLTQCFP